MRTLKRNAIADLLRRHDITREELARILEVQPHYVDALERHANDIPCDVIGIIDVWVRADADQHAGPNNNG